MREAIKEIVDKYGKEILLNRTKFMYLFTSLYPDLQKEKKAIALVLNENVTELLVNCDEKDKEKNILEAKKRIVNVSSLTDKAGKSVLMAFVYALGWDKRYANIIRENDGAKEFSSDDVNLPSKPSKDNKTSHHNVFKYCLAVACIIGALFGIIAFVRSSKVDYSSVERVEAKLKEVLSDEDYADYDLDTKKEVCLDALKELKKEKCIKDITYNEESLSFEFTYKDGTLGGVMLEEFDERFEGIERNYADLDSKGKVKNVNNKIEYGNDDYPYVEKDLKCKVMYGLGYEEVFDDIKSRAKVWKSEYLDTEIDDYCTVEDFRTGLKGNDLIIISEHGSLYDNIPVICTKEVVTESNMKKYKKDLKKGNIVVVNVIENDEIQTHYWIKPSFIEDNYKNKELEGSIVYLGCCHGYENDKLVKAFSKGGADSVIGNSNTVYSWYNANMQDAFVYSLLCGDTVGEALNYAKSIWGENDVQWGKRYLSKPDDKVKAETMIYCGERVKLVNLAENGNSEEVDWDVIHVLPLGDTMYPRAYDSYWSMMETGDDVIEDNVNHMAYIDITNIDEIKEIYTEKGFEQFVKENGIFMRNGKYYKPYGDRGMDFDYIDHSLSFDYVDEKKNKIYYTSFETYDNPDRPVVENEFVLAFEDGKWRVEEFTLPN